MVILKEGKGKEWLVCNFMLLIDICLVTGKLFRMNIKYMV